MQFQPCVPERISCRRRSHTQQCDISFPSLQIVLAAACPDQKFLRVPDPLRTFRTNIFPVDHCKPGYIPDPVASLTECLSSSHPFHLFSLDHRRMILRPFKRLISRLLSGFFSGSKVGPARYSISLSRFTKYLFPHITCGIVPSSTNCLMR